MKNRMWKISGAIAALFGAIALPLRAEPTPSPIQTSWELTLQPGTPSRIQADGRTYWYMLYTVINNTGQDVDFHPDIVRVNEIENELTAEQAAAQPDRAPRVSVDPAIVGVPTRLQLSDTLLLSIEVRLAPRRSAARWAGQRVASPVFR